MLNSLYLIKFIIFCLLGTLLAKLGHIFLQSIELKEPFLPQMHTKLSKNFNFLGQMGANYWQGRRREFLLVFNLDRKQKAKTPELMLHGETREGRKLLFMLSRLESLANGNYARIERLLPNLPRYKFFDGLLLQLAETYRLWGEGLQQLATLRKLLVDDLDLEQEWLRSKRAFQFQAMVMAWISLLFSWQAQNVLNLEASFVSYLILMGQIVSLVGLQGLYEWWRKKIFLQWDLWIAEVAILRERLKAGGETNLLIPPVFARLVNLNQGELKDYQAQFKEAYNFWQVEGGDIGQELGCLMDDLVSRRRARFQEFNRHLNAVNFTVLALVFLGGHCWNLLRLADQLLGLNSSL